MSKKYIIALALLLIVGNIANAQQGNSTSTRREDRKEVRQEIREEVREQIEKKEAQMRGIFLGQTRKVTLRLEATIERLETIMSRVVSRIAKIKNAGGDVTSAEKYVAEAKTHLAEARTELAKLKTTVDSGITTVSSTTPMSKELKKMKDISKNVQKHIVEAHKSLEKAVGSLKGRSSTAPNSTTTNN